jgi:hypothetical protein
VPPAADRAAPSWCASSPGPGRLCYDEAASALFVSPRTIETHLRQIYGKVGVRSRSEMARRLSMPAGAGTA